jgi:hypothetical protein
MLHTEGQSVCSCVRGAHSGAAHKTHAAELKQVCVAPPWHQPVLTDTCIDLRNEFKYFYCSGVLGKN